MCATSTNRTQDLSAPAAAVCHSVFSLTLGIRRSTLLGDPTLSKRKRKKGDKGAQRERGRKRKLFLPSPSLYLVPSQSALGQNVNHVKEGALQAHCVSAKRVREQEHSKTVHSTHFAMKSSPRKDYTGRLTLTTGEEEGNTATT